MDLYLRYIEITVSRYAIEELIDIWVNSLSCGHLGTEIRQQITQAVSFIADYHQLELTTNTFQNLVEKYEAKTFFAACPEDPNYALVYFAKKGNLAGVRYTIRQGADKIYQANKAAIKNGDQNLVAFLLSLCTKAQQTDFYFLACKHKQKAIIDLSKPTLESDDLFLAALYEGDLEKAQKHVQHRNKHRCSLLLKAAIYSGSLDTLVYILQFCEPSIQTARRLAHKIGKLNRLEMIPLLEKYAYIEHELFIGAAKGGHFFLLEKLAPKVLSNLATAAAAIQAATQGYHMEVVYFLVKQCDFILSYAVLNSFEYENMPMLEFLIQNQVEINWVDGLVKAAKIGSRRLVDFCLAQAPIEKKYILSLENIARKEGYPTLANYFSTL